MPRNLPLPHNVRTIRTTLRLHRFRRLSRLRRSEPVVLRLRCRIIAVPACDTDDTGSNHLTIDRRPKRNATKASSLAHVGVAPVGASTIRGGSKRTSSGGAPLNSWATCL